MAEAFFLPSEPGRRFCIHHPASGDAARGGIVYAHPFGEEMHKSRRMAALQSRRLSAAGYSVLQIDLFGCGDSSGDFGEARWDIWKQDLLLAIEWLRLRAAPLMLWGLRVGALLAAEVARDPNARVDRLLLWQPVTSGAQFLVQFLRLRLAAEMLAEGSSQTGVQQLRQRLAQGEALEIAGYELHPQLAAEMDSRHLGELMPPVKRVLCLEVAAGSEPQVSVGSKRAMGSWQAKGVDVHAQAVSGPPFWATAEIAESEALLEATERAVRLE